MSNVLVVGAAISGQAACHYLVKQGYTVYLTDMKPLKNKEELEKEGIIVYDGGHPDLLKEIEFDFIVKNPGIRYTTPFISYFVAKNMPIYNEIEVALRDNPQVRYAAVTGTNGKTTTTMMLKTLLQSKNPDNEGCGNIGLPCCTHLKDHMHQDIELAIEIGAFQLLGVETFKPHVSVITNLTPDHVDFFGDCESYYKSKTNIYKLQDENDYFIRNVDDENIMRICTDIPCQVIDFSLTREDVALHISNHKAYYNDIELFDLKKFKLPGMHNVENAMYASCMAYLMGVKLEDIHEIIENFKSVEHRIEYVRELDGVRYYNDSKGTNVDSTIIALKSFDCPVHLLVGGYDKKVTFDDLKPYLGNVKKMYAFGQTKQMFADLFENTEMFETMQQATDAAYNEAKEGEVVLLSPVCASWDQFPNFEVRGKIFKDIVNNYKSKTI